MCGQWMKSLLYLVSWLVFILTINGLALAEDSTKKKPEETTKPNQQTTPHERGTKDSPIVIQVDPSTSLKIETDHEQQAEHDKSTNEWMTARGTAALAVFTFGLDVVTLGLAIFTYKLWKATSLLVIGADDTTRRQLRAYMCISSCTIQAFPNEKRLLVSAAVKNCGPTPAYKVRIGYNLEVLHPSDTPDLLKSPKTKNVYGMAGPNMPIDWDKQLDTAQDTIQEIRMGTKMIYLWGTVTYEDAFKKTRTTQFNFFCKGNPGPFEWRMKPAESGNEGD